MRPMCLAALVGRRRCRCDDCRGGLHVKPIAIGIAAYVALVVVLMWMR